MTNLLDSVVFDDEQPQIKPNLLDSVVFDDELPTSGLATPESNINAQGQSSIGDAAIGLGEAVSDAWGGLKQAGSNFADSAKRKGLELAARGIVSHADTTQYLGDRARDLSLSALSGTVMVPEGVVGLADIPTGGKVGKALESVGFRPAEARAAIQGAKSQRSKDNLQEFSDAEGIWDKTKVVLENPSLAIDTTVESLPAMGAGGVYARGLGALAAMGGFGKVASNKVLLGAAGEGLISAGMQASQIRNETDDRELTFTQSGLALATGFTTALFGFAGGKVSQWLDVSDINTLVAGGERAAAEALRNGSGTTMAKKAVLGGISEGFLQELPQELLEQILQNIALDKPWAEGLDDAAVLAVMSGGIMGAASANLGGVPPNPNNAPPNPNDDGLQPEDASGELPQQAMDSPSIDEQLMAAVDRFHGDRNDSAAIYDIGDPPSAIEIDNTGLPFSNELEQGQDASIPQQTDRPLDAPVEALQTPKQMRNIDIARNKWDSMTKDERIDTAINELGLNQSEAERLAGRNFEYLGITEARSLVTNKNWLEGRSDADLAQPEQAQPEQTQTQPEAEEGFKQDAVEGDAQPGAVDSSVEVDLFGNPIEQNAVEGLPVQEVPLGNLTLSKEVPQFKEGADDSGVVEPLGGKFDRRGVAPIQVWERLDGSLEIISGRHRFDLAKRSGEQTIPAQIHREADGFDAVAAATLDAELNIRDEQGGIADYANYFRNSQITEEEADARGLLARQKGKAGFIIGNLASDDTFASHSAGIITDEAARRIAEAAPNNDGLQAVGLKSLQEGSSIADAVNTIHAVSTFAPQGNVQQGDIFGMDTSGIEQAKKMARIATSKQRDIQANISAAKNAAKSPERANKMGIDVKNPGSVLSKIRELEAEKQAWDKWSTNPDLVAQIRAEMQPEEGLPTPKKQGVEKPAESAEKPAAETEAQTKGLDTPPKQKDPDDDLPTPKSIADIDKLEKDTIYKRGGKYLVRSEGRRGGGDRIFNTRAEAEKYVEQEKRLKSENDKYRAEHEAKDKAKKDIENAKEQALIDSYDGYLSDTPMVRKRQRNALEKKLTYEGKVYSRKELVEKLVDEGREIRTHEQVDNAATQKIKDELRSKRLQFAPANENHPDAIRKKELQAIIDAGGVKKSIRTLFDPKTELFIDESTLTKTAMDYAAHVISRKKDDGFGLSQQTEEELSRQDEERKAAEEKLAKEQEAEAKAEREAAEKAAVKQRMESANEEFTLGQDAYENLSGQRNMMDLLDDAASEVNVDPTEAQKEAGNYKKGHVSIQGLDVSIENPKDSERSGIEANGKPWSVKMKNHYGYIKKTEGADGDQVDVFIGENPESDSVFIVDQINQGDGTFDEHKVMLGFTDKAQAINAYKSNYSSGWKVGKTTKMSMDEFKAWLKDGDTTQPVADAVSESQKTKSKGQAESVKNDKQDDAQTIDDFGEKLEGARKDLPRNFSDDLSDGDVKSQPLSKLWPSDLHTKIDNPVTAAIMFVLRQSIPSKPRVGYKLNRWVQAVQSARIAANELIDTQTLEQLDAKAKEKGFILSREKIFTPAKVLSQLPKESWGRISDITERPNSYRFGEDGETIPAPSSVIRIDGTLHRFEVGEFGAKEISEIKRLLNVQPETGLTTRDFDIYTRRSDGTTYITRKIDKEKRSLKEFTKAEGVKAAREYLKSNLAELEAAWEAVKERDNIGKSDVRNKSNRERLGKDWRKGKDITPEQFSDAFGFRGVQFGNWVSQGKGGKERQGMLNQAYDALMDLSSILNVPPKALSLNGTLGLAFGARGKGRAMAHYERDTVVINLTKTKGAGSLAHEWFHALDNYFAGLRGIDQSAKESFVTYQPEAYYVHKRGNAKIAKKDFEKAMKGEKFNGGYVISGARNPSDWTLVDGIRPEVETAFANLVEALNKAPMHERAKVLDQGSSKKYWSSIIERAARSFEDYTIMKLDEEGITNDYLANVVSFKEFKRAKERYPYNKPEEMQPIKEAFDVLFNTIESREDADGNVALYSRNNDRNKQGMDKEAVENIANRLLRGKDNRVHIVQSYGDLPKDVRAAIEHDGTSEGDFDAVHHKGKSYIVADAMGSQAEVEAAIFHEHFTHGGLRTLYGKDLANKLDDMLFKAGGIAGVRMQAKKQGIDLSAYESALAGNPNISPENKKRILMEELLAHMAHTTGTLRRRLEEVMGAIRQWLRDNGFAELAKLSASDIAYTMKQAREAQVIKDSDSQPTFVNTSVINEREQAYETDLFGDPIPNAGRKDKRTEAKRGGRNVQPASELRDSPAPDGEYIRRTILGVEKHKTIPVSKISSFGELATASRGLYDSAVEHFEAYVTDKNGKVLGVVGNFKGAISKANVYLDVVLFEALRLEGAKSIWLTHNHPSGTSELSDADRNLTKQFNSMLDGTGLDVQGIIAVSQDEYTAFSPNDRYVELDNYQKSIPDPSGKTSVPVIERQLERHSGRIEAVTSPDTGLKISEALYKQSGNKSGILFLDNQHYPVAYVPVTEAMKGILRQDNGGALSIYRAASESNASAAIIVHDGDLDVKIGGTRTSIASNLASAVTNIQMRALDIINVKTGISEAETGFNVGGMPMLSRSQRASPAVDTPAFKRWFGDSKVVDAQGKPLRVKHGSREVFTEFREKRGGMYFSEDGAAVTAIFTEEGRGDIGEYYLSLQNPFDARWKNMSEAQKTELREIIESVVDESDIEDAAAKLEVPIEDADPFEVFTDGEFFWGYGRDLQNSVMEAIKRRGYDGVIFPDALSMGEEHVSYVAFRNDQIKSATDNDGNFDPSNPDIRYSQTQQDQPRASLSASSVSETLNSALGERLASAVNVVQSERDLPKGLVPIESNDIIEGAFDPSTNKIYLIADNLVTPERAVWVAFHELFHRGIRSTRAFTDYQATLSRAGNNKMVDRVADAIMREHNLRNKEEAVEEALAELNAAEETGDYSQIESRYGVKVLNGLKHGIRKHIESFVNAVRRVLYGISGKVYVSDAEVWRVIQGAREGYAEFDANGNRINYGLFSRQQQGNLSGLGEAPEETKFRLSQRMLQDAFNRFEVIQDWLKESGVNLQETSRVYEAETRMSGRIAAQLEDFRDKTFAPLIKKVAKAGKTMEQLEDLLHAQHAQERNAHIATINKAFPDGGSGMTNADAKAILAQYANDTALQDLANEFREISKRRLELLVKEGIYSQQDADNMQNTYQFYVPLKGGPDTEYFTGTGKGLTGKKDIKRALGHTEREGGESIVENIAVDFERAIMLAEKNRMAKHLLSLALDANDPNLISLGKPEKRAILTSKSSYGVWYNGSMISSFSTMREARNFIAVNQSLVGNKAVIQKTTDQSVVYTAMPQLDSNETVVFINGQQIRIQINDELLARAWNNLGQNGVIGILKMSAGLNRWLSKVYTGYSPDFFVRNIIRDFSTGFSNVTGEEGFTTAVRAVMNYPSAVKQLMKYYATGQATPMIQSYRDAGGKTGGTWMSDLERVGDDVSKSYNDAIKLLEVYKRSGKRAATASALRRVFSPLFNYVEKFNAVSENSYRVAIYQTMVQQGRTVEDAAYRAKNVTVNFSKKGEWGTSLNAYSLFYNASIQGAANYGHAMIAGKHREQLWALTAGLASMAFMMAQAGYGGDDDDQDKLKDFELERSIPIKTSNGWITIPIPYEMGFFWSFGRHMSDLVDGKNSVQQTALKMAYSFASAYSVYGDVLKDGELDSKNLYTLLPTAIQIPAGPIVNRSTFGSPIYPESSFDPQQPDSQKMYRNTKGSIFELMTTTLNNLSGGDSVTEGAISVSPETLKYLNSALTGGAGRFIYDAMNIPAMLMQGVELGDLDSRDIPIARVVYKTETITEQRNKFRTRAAKQEQALENFNRAKSVVKDQMRYIGESEEGLIEKYGFSQSQLIEQARLAEAIRKLAGDKRKAQAVVLGDKSRPLAARRADARKIEQEEQELYEVFFNNLK